MGEPGAPAAPGVLGVARSFGRALFGRRPAREAVLAHLDLAQRRRGRANAARRFTPEDLCETEPRLHLEVLDPPGARVTVVFVPGTNAYSLLYADFLAALADAGLRVVGLDPRGHGLSGGRPGDYVLTDLVDDLDRAVAHVRARFGDPVVVAGSSQGGIAAFYYAASSAPIAGAICHNAADLTDPASLSLTRLPPRLAARLAPWIRRAARLVPGAIVPMEAYLALGREPVQGWGDSHRALHGDPALVPFVRLATLASLSSTPLPTPVERIRVPVMLLHGGADTIFPRELIEDLHARLTCEKRLSLHSGLPHYLIVDHVPAFLEDVLAFVRAVTSERERR